MKNNELKKLKSRNFIESAWISNFWIANNKLFLTDGNINVKNNLLAYIDLDKLIDNFKNKQEIDRLFLVKPNEYSLGANKISQTDVEICFISNDTVQNILYLNEKYLITFIKRLPNDKFETITFLYDKEFLQLSELHELKNKVIIAVDNSLLYLSDTNTEICSTMNIKTNQITQHLFKARKILILKEHVLVLDHEDNIFELDNLKFKNKLDFPEGIKNICKLDESSFLISFRETNITQYYSFKDNGLKLFSKKAYFRLLVFNKEFFIGKPLFNNENKINYHQPLEFIY